MRTVAPGRCNIAFFGFGAVGQAVAALCAHRRCRYRELYGVDVRVVGILRSRVQMLDRDGIEIGSLTPSDGRWQPAGESFVETPYIDVLIDAGPSDVRTGGRGLLMVESVLARGCHVIAVSKGAVAKCGPALCALAARTGAMLEVSAAAGAALPALDLLRHAVRGCDVLTIEGIFNATTNHLLDAMSEGGLSLEQALERARQDGIVESDPRMDIEGWDTAAKLVLLAVFGLGASLTIDDVALGGIQNLTASECRDMKARGHTPKLVGALHRSGDVFTASVALRALPASDPLARIGGSDKAMRITTDAMGDIFASVSGAEPLATAAAALKDFETMLTATG